MKGESEESSMDHHSYTTEEVAKRLKVSKLTVYDLIKKENFLLIELVDRCALMQRFRTIYKANENRENTRYSCKERR